MNKKTEASSRTRDVPELADTLRQTVSDFVRSVRAQADGPSTAQSETLLQLDRAGPSSVAALADMRGVKHQSMRQVIAILEADGLVSRVAHPKDGRSQLVHLTGAGESALKSARVARSEWLTAALSTKLADSELEVLRAAIPVLRKIVA